MLSRVAPLAAFALALYFGACAAKTPDDRGNLARQNAELTRQNAELSHQLTDARKAQVDAHVPATSPTTAPAAAKVAYTNKSCGFSINPPDFHAPVAGAFVPAAFSGPAKNGFSSNVSVMIQMLRVARQKYIETTRAELMQQHGKFNSSRELTVSGRDAAIMDYETTLDGQNMHFLALVVFDTDHIYLVTCAALAKEFAAQKADFQKCLESFKLDAGPRN